MEKIAKKSDVWMPLYIGDYLGATQRLTTEQHGAYLLLLIDYWRNGAPPDDDAILANITRLKPSAWRKVRPVIIEFFKPDGGRLIHTRAEAERAKAAEHSARRSDKAKKAADARWHQEPNAPSNAPSMPEAMLVECPPPSPSFTNVKARDVPKSVFDQGTDLLVAKGGSQGSSRALIAGMVKEHGEARVGSLIQECIDRNVIDPRGYLIRSLKNAANDQDAFLRSIHRTYGAGQ
jgi:uncharacterized protein YdaU (DUF1376 family)